MKLTLFLIVCFFSCKISNKRLVNHKPLTKQEAISIAEELWVSEYGEVINEKKPFEAKLEFNIWHVSGTLSDIQYNISPEGDTLSVIVPSGGVPHAFVDIKTRKVIHYYYDK